LEAHPSPGRRCPYQLEAQLKYSVVSSLKHNIHFRMRISKEGVYTTYKW